MNENEQASAFCKIRRFVPRGTRKTKNGISLLWMWYPCWLMQRTMTRRVTTGKSTKKRLKDEGSQLVTDCNQLKFETPTERNGNKLTNEDVTTNQHTYVRYVYRPYLRTYRTYLPTYLPEPEPDVTLVGYVRFGRSVGYGVRDGSDGTNGTVTGNRNPGTGPVPVRNGTGTLRVNRYPVTLTVR